MAKKHRNLIGPITDDANMRAAYRRTARGRRLTSGHLEFKEFSSLNLERLADEMRSGAYRQGEPRRFEIFDPKRREISALPFRDRVAQHALCAIIEPIFDATLLPRSYACRRGKGTHAGADHCRPRDLDCFASSAAIDPMMVFWSSRTSFSVPSIRVMWLSRSARRT